MKKVMKILVPLVMVLFIAASIAWYLCIYDRGFTRDFLLSQARFHDLHGNSQISSMFYDMAYSFSGRDEDVAIELANQYKSSGNYTKAEATLTRAIRSGPTTELYTALCKTFVEQDKLLDAASLLDNISSPTVKEEITALRPSAPDPDATSGYYSQYLDLHLQSTGDIIFYSTDGAFPSTQGNVYDGAIALPAGQTQIYAIAVSSAGLVSRVTLLDYTITGVIEEVHFVDPAIEGALREMIHVSDTKTVYTDELWQITDFAVPEEAAVFDDLAHLPYLKNLVLQDQAIDNLHFLENLTNLETLNLSGSQFPADGLEILAALPNLKELTLENCNLSTIAGLAGAPALTHLNLNQNTIRNLEVITGMTTLQELKLEHNAVSGLDALANMPALTTLDLSFNAITNLAPLSGCTGLTWLEVDNNQLSSLNGVGSLAGLMHLSAAHNTLTGIQELSGNPELKELDISSNSITDIALLGNMTKLEDLNFSGNQVAELPRWPDGAPLQSIDGSYNALTSVDTLSNMHALTSVNMDYNLLTNIDALADCYCLVQVNVFGNQIPDVSKLREREIIVNYDPTVTAE